MLNLCQFLFHQHGGSHFSIEDLSSKHKDMNKRITNTNKQGANSGENNEQTSLLINGQKQIEWKKRTNGWKNERTKEWANEQIDGQTDKRLNMPNGQ